MIYIHICIHIYLYIFDTHTHTHTHITRNLQFSAACPRSCVIQGQCPPCSAHATLWGPHKCQKRPAIEAKRSCIQAKETYYYHWHTWGPGLEAGTYPRLSDSKGPPLGSKSQVSRYLLYIHNIYIYGTCARSSDSAAPSLGSESHVSSYVYKYVHIQHTHTRTRTHKYIDVYVCMYVCIYIHTYPKSRASRYRV
jgi:hypothetical protein